MLKFLELLGMPTKLPTGHDLGCLCEECHAYRRAREERVIERIQKGEEPKTILEILAQKKRKESEQ